MIGAVRQPYLAGGQRRRAAARRAARCQRRVPGVARAPEHLVEGGAAGAELRRVRLGDDDAALALDALHHGVRGLGHVVPEDRRAVGRAHAGDVGQVLDGDRQAAEPSGLTLGLAPLAAHEAPGVLARAIEAQGRQRVDRGLDLGDAPLGRVDQVERRDVAALQARHRLRRRQADQLVVRAGIASPVPDASPERQRPLPGQLGRRAVVGVALLVDEAVVGVVAEDLGASCRPP